MESEIVIYGDLDLDWVESYMYVDSRLELVMKSGTSHSLAMGYLEFKELFYLNIVEFFCYNGN